MFSSCAGLYLRLWRPRVESGLRAAAAAFCCPHHFAPPPPSSLFGDMLQRMRVTMALVSAFRKKHGLMSL